MATREKLELNIPVNLKTRTEFLEGYGVQELLQTLIIGSVGIIISLLLYLIIKNDFISILLAFIFFAGGFFLTIKDSFTLSLLDQLIIGYKFGKIQKKYKYKYGGVIIDEHLESVDEKTKKK